MINFHYETQFELPNEAQIEQWISKVIASENKREGEINYIFCDDEYLHKLNVEFLQHDTLTDIISFDNSVGNELHGDIFISIERVEENAKEYQVTFDEELKRVMVHGVLHYCGFKDKTETDQVKMTTKEDEKLQMFHVEQQ